ncbi:MAG: ABC transporter permease [Angelakisella sp.]|nr:ABC transporter permease [Angelakisella sp.]
MSKQKEPKVGSPLSRGAVRLLGNEKYQSFAIPVFAILLSLLAASLVLLMVGKNPLEAFTSLLKGAGVLPKASYAAKKSMFTDFMSMLGSLTPMIFAALAVAVAFKTGLFNIGVSGQMLLGGFVATVAIGYSDLPAVVAKPLVLVVGAVMGALAGALIGWLKYRFNINEVVSSIMLNYIFSYVISFFINSYFVDAVSRQSRRISAASSLTLVNVELWGLKMDIPLGFILVIPAALLVKFFLDKTRVGYELKTVGLNQKAARYAGINVGRSIVLSMTISGALAGLAGVTYYLGYFNSIQPKVLSSVGFDAIAVSLVGNSNPIGILFSSLLITIVSKGSNYMSSTIGVQQEIAQVVTGLILLFSACSVYIHFLVNRKKEQLEEERTALAKKQPEVQEAQEGGDR